MQFKQLIPITALFGAGLIAACAPGNDTAQAEASGNDDSVAARVVNVEIEPARSTTFQDYIRITGEVEALHDVTLSAEESGPIAEFLVAKGARVAAGQAIAKIDDEVLSAQVDEARAMANLAREQYERQKRVWEESQAGTEMAVLQAKSAYEQAAARLKTLEARLERTVIKAPVAGIFDEKMVEIGEMVAPGTPVVRVVSTGRVKVTGGVPERYALEVNRGDSAQVTLDLLPGRLMMGRINFVGASVDRQSRTVPIEIVMDNPDGFAKPRMVANVRIRRTSLANVIVVPQQILRRTEDGFQVFVATDEHGRLVARARAVTTGPSQGNQVVIRSGLTAGDSVIVVGDRLVDPGSFVRIVNVREEER
jgi:membrane fusion protein (multidrug efflux system)